MSLTALLKPAASGLSAAQPNARRTSDHVASVGGSGHVRDAVQASQIGRAPGLGVSIEDAERIFDQHLSLTRLNASSEASRWSAISSHLQKAGEAMEGAESLLAGSGRIKAQLAKISGQAEAQIHADVDRANDLLDRLSRLNSDISRANVANDDTSGPEETQAQLIDELAALMNVRVAQKAAGGATVRSPEGLRLAGDGEPARLSYNRADPTRGYIAVEPADGAGFAQPIQVLSGEIGGLIDLRDATLPGLARRLDELEVGRQAAAAGDMSADEIEAANVSLRGHAAELGASIERQAQAADIRKHAALAVVSEAASRREAGERVNVDAELAVMASYQQASNASARMIQAARALLAVLTG